MNPRPVSNILRWLSVIGLLWGSASAQTIGQQSLVHGLLWDIHEMTIGQVKQYAAATGFAAVPNKKVSALFTRPGGVKKRGGHGANLLVFLPSTLSPRCT